MSCFTCGRRKLFQDLSRAAAKLAGDRLRRVGALAEHPAWTTRAAVCEFCPIRVIRGGKTYCGQPFLSQVQRPPAEGCGCPISAKAKDPAEHCPLDSSNRLAVNLRDGCTCKWCASGTHSAVGGRRNGPSRHTQQLN